MPSGIEGSRAAFRAEFAGGMRKIIKGATTMTDDVKIKIFSILFGYEKPKPSKLKWKKLKEKYPDYEEVIPDEGDYDHATIGINLDLLKSFSRV